MSEGAATPLIVVGEADVLARHALSEYLRHCGYGVILAADTDEVMIALGEMTLDIDIVLCDAQLHGSLNAFALRAWIAQHRPGVDLELAGSVAAAANAAAEICENGPQLSRPYDPGSVVERVNKLRAARARNA